jgi:hypothetical protein
MSKSKMEKILTNYVPPTKKITFGRRKSLNGRYSPGLIIQKGA